MTTNDNENILIIKKFLIGSETQNDPNKSINSTNVNEEHSSLVEQIRLLKTILGYSEFEKYDDWMDFINKSRANPLLNQIRHLLTILTYKNTDSAFQTIVNKYNITDDRKDFIAKQSDIENLKTHFESIYQDIANIQTEVENGVKISQSSMLALSNKVANVQINLKERTTIGEVLTFLNQNYKANHSQAILQTYEKLKDVYFQNFAVKGEYSQTLQAINNHLVNKIPNIDTFTNNINNIILKIDNLPNQLTTINKNVIKVNDNIAEVKQQNSNLSELVNTKLTLTESNLTKQFDDVTTKITQSVNTNLSTLNSTLQKSASAIELEKTQGLINRDVVAPLKQLNDKQSEFNNTQQSILNILDERLRKPVENANPDEETIIEMADYGVRILEELTSMARSYAKNKDTINGNQQQIQQTKDELEKEKQDAIKKAQREVEKSIINNYINSYGSMNDLDSIYDNQQHSKFIQQYIKRDAIICKNNPSLLSIDAHNTSKINNSHSIKNQFKVIKSCFYNNFGEIIQWATVVEAGNVVTQPDSKPSSSSDNLGY